MEHIIKIDQNKCIGCHICEKTCVAHNIESKEGKANIIANDCLMCGQCSAVCPKEAIHITGYDDIAKAMNEHTLLDPNQVLDTIRFRRTIRQFQKKGITKDVITQVLEAGRLTHTAKNMQDVSFVVLDNKKEEVEHLAVRFFRKLKPFINMVNAMARKHEINDNFFFFNAPIVIVILAKDTTNGILAAQNMEFVAEANGLGVLFSGFFTMAANHSRAIKRVLSIPKGKKVAATLVLGYPSVKFQRSASRKKLHVKYM